MLLPWSIRALQRLHWLFCLPRLVGQASQLYSLVLPGVILLRDSRACLFLRIELTFPLSTLRALLGGRGHAGAPEGATQAMLWAGEAMAEVVSIGGQVVGARTGVGSTRSLSMPPELSLSLLGLRQLLLRSERVRG